MHTALIPKVFYADVEVGIDLARVKRQPWGPREFALLDATTVCLVLRDWT